LEQRIDGFKKAFSESPGVELVQVVDTQSTDNEKAHVSGAPAVVDTGVIIIDKSTCEYFFRK
jgi:hypothetical protein